MSEAPPNAEAFSAWMDEEGFTAGTLAAALGCNRVTVWKWQTGVHAVSPTTWLAIKGVAGGARGRKSRQAKAAAAAK